MAMEQIVSTQLRLTFFEGYDEESDKNIYVRKSFNNINAFATSDALLAVSEAMATLQTLPLDAVERADVVAIH